MAKQKFTVLETREELRFILDRVRGDEKYVIPAQVLGDYKQYSTKEFHRMGGVGDEECEVLYDRIRDIFESRIFEGVNKGGVNAALGLKALGEFFERGVEEKGGGDYVIQVIEQEVGL